MTHKILKMHQISQSFNHNLKIQQYQLGTVEPNNFIECNIDLIMVHEQLGGRINKEYYKLGINYVKNPEKIVYILDHWVPSPDIRAARMHQEANEFAKNFGFLKENILGENKGICHTVIPEQGYIYPSMIAVGSDSHTTTYGAFNCFATGIGATDVCTAFATGTLWFKVPEVFRFNLKGKFNKGVFAKDFILTLLRDFKSDGAIYKALEFGGPALQNLSISSRITIANMSVEMGAKNAIFEYDKILEEWYLSNPHVKNTTTNKPILPDKDANYEKSFDYNLNEIEPVVACPHSPDNVKNIDELPEIHIDQGFIGSCTNGSLEDLRIAAKILKNKKIHPNTRCIILPASTEIFQNALKEGLIEIFIKAGCVVGPPTCGPCIGGHLGVLGDNETQISSSNRNFRGRMGSEFSNVYLGSPATVVASVIEGKIVSPIKYF
ncbi:MAG: 3-isopropylmalate dehydratase large subunit [Promethearchaeota archaeon]